MKRITLLLFIIALARPFYAQSEKYRLIIGTYTNTGKSQGIYTYDVEMKNAVFTQKSVSPGIVNPSYLTLTPDKKFVYAVSENGDKSRTYAFAFDKNTAKLTLLNSSPTNGDDPCYILSTKTHVFTANYSSGSISVFGRNTDGSLTKVLQKIQHTGKSINTERQNGPHVHQTILSPDNKYLITNDLGTDKVTVYRYNPKANGEILTPWDTLSVKQGSGPRHVTFSKDGKRLYLLQELDGTVSVIAMRNGKLSLIQESSVVRNGKNGASAADIHLSTDGKFLYASNRAPANNMTCFSIGKAGKLEFVQQISSGGNGPRNFAISPDGKYIFVANQNTDNIVVFKRDAKTGLLTDTGKRIETGAPVCLIFF